MRRYQIGTSYFTDLAAAVSYYSGYAYEDAAETVQRKIRDGEIHLGQPRIKPGERLITVDGGLRYAIEWSE